MAASNTCDGCSLVVNPEDAEKDWLILHVPKGVSDTPTPEPNSLESMLAMMQQQQTKRYDRYEFCSWNCIVTKAIVMQYSEGLEV